MTIHDEATYLLRAARAGDGLRHDDEVHTHHRVPQREGSLGPEPTYVQACACGCFYRHGLVVTR